MFGLKALTEKVNEIVQRYLPGTDEPSHMVAEAMAYAMSSGGKRIRPLIMYLTYRAASSEDEYIRDGENPFEVEDSDLFRFMAAIEMIHTSSLIHDDLPALDNDSLRRGMPTVHIKFREDVAILAGDALMNYAYETAGEALKAAPGSIRHEKALLTLMDKTGIFGMLGGQSADVVLSGSSISEEEREFIYEKKTSALIEAPFMIGALLAGADDERVRRLEQAGRKLGIAFQVRDDMLDVISDAETLGKDVGQDEKNNKSTYVAQYGMEAADKYVRELTESVREILSEVFDPEGREEAALLTELVYELAGRNN